MPPTRDEEIDLYESLEISPKATPEVIRAAYYHLARKYHPDKAGPSAAAAQRIRQINAAYSVLRDPVQRANYDAQRAWAARARQTAERYGSAPRATASANGAASTAHASRPRSNGAGPGKAAEASVLVTAPVPTLTANHVRQAVVLVLALAVLLGILVGALVVFIQANDDEPSRYFESLHATDTIALVAAAPRLS